MGTAGLGLVLGGSLVVGRGCLPWWCHVLCRGACWRAVPACVPCLACVWRALLARACCCARAGTHPLSGGPVWLHGGPCWRPAAARCAAAGCVYVGGGGGFVTLPSPSPPCPSVPFRRPALPAYPLRTRWVGLGWTVGLGGLTWCFFPARRRGLGSFWGRVARVVCRVACTVSWASWLLFTSVHALCVVLRVRCPGPLGSCSPVCTLYVWCCVYGVLGLLVPVHRCARSVCGVACTVSWASGLLFTSVHALCVVLRVWCPWPPGSCSPVCTLCAWCCVYGVLGLLAPVHRCARSVCGVACTASWASRLLFTGVHALCAVLCARCPGPPGSCSPVCTLCVWCCVYGVLGLLAPVHRCARSVSGVACTVSWAAWLLFTGVHALCVVLRVRCPGPPGSCSPMCTLCVWCCVYGVLGLLAPVHRCARSVCGVACTVSWASWLLFTGVQALCVVLRVRCPGPLGSCSPVCTLCVWCCVYGVLGLLAPVHRCARSVCGVVCAASWAAWLLFTCVPAPVCGVACMVSWASCLLFTGVHALCVVLRVRCPGPPGSCSPVRTLCVWCCVRGVLGRLAPVHLCIRSGVLCRVYGVLGPLAPVHRCARFVCGVVCAVSWASRLLFSGARARCVVSFVSCSGLLGSCPPACPLCVRCRVCGLLGLLALLCWCARVVCVVLCVWCPATLGSWSPVSRCVAVCVVSGVRCCVCGVLGLPAPVHRCARPVCGVVWAVSRAAWLLFTGVLVRCVVWCVRCPGPLGSRSPVCPRGVCCVACSVSWAPWLPFTGILCACSVCCVLCAVSWATWPLFTGVRARCVAWCVRCGCGGVLACAIPLQRRCGLFVFVYTWIDTVGNAAANSPLASQPPRRPASYGVLLILPVLDSLILATPKSKRVLMHAWRCILFTRWFVDSLHFATPKSRRVCLMHS